MSISEKLVAVSENVLKVFEAGKKAEYDAFWDNYQDYGNRTIYKGAFMGYNAERGKYWNIKTVRPKYDMYPTNAQQMFAYSGIEDLTQLLKDCNVKLDFSQCTTVSECFSYGSITHIPDLDLRKLDSVNFGTYNSPALHTIDKIILREDGSQTFSSSLAPNSPSLKNIIFEGTIGNNMKLTNKNLSVDSLMSIIEHLQNLIEVGKSACTLTIGTTNLNKLTDEQKAIATQKGWTLA